MNILLTNDDGYLAKGIQILYEKLSPNHNVYLCAPLKQMSASSHAISLFKPMEIKKVSENIYALDGTPADCVKVALLHLFKEVSFDIVLSGINDGPNMGEDIFYSGTVAGAREGLMNDIFSIASSIDGWSENKNFDKAASFLSELLQNIPKAILKEKIFLNINFPGIPNFKGIKVTHLGKRIYKDFVIYEEKDGKSFATLTGDEPGFSPHNGSDMSSVSEGYISITPLANEVFDPRLRDRLSYLEKIEWKTIF